MNTTRIIETKLQNKNTREFEGEVSITEIVACQYDKEQYEKSGPTPAGEFNLPTKKRTETKKNVLKRMVEFVSEIGSWAEGIHVKENFSNPNHYLSKDESKKLAEEENIVEQKTESKLLESKLNHITRFSLNEFSLYPAIKYGSLSLEEFKWFLEQLEEITRGYPDNLHLFLGSLPVKTSKNKTENIGIYIECGTLNHSIHVLAKAVPAAGDKVYPGTSPALFNTRVVPIATDASQTLKANVAPMALPHNSLIGAIPYTANFISETAGRIKFRVSAELCFDHLYSLAKDMIEKEIQSANTTSSHFLATQASYLLSSNVIPLDVDKVTAETYVHADAWYCHHSNSTGKGPTRLSASNSQLLKTPAFGFPVVGYTYPPQVIGKHSPDLQDKIVAVNAQTLERQTQTLLEANSHANVIKPDMLLTSFLLAFTMGKFVVSILPASSANTRRTLNHSDIKVLTNNIDRLLELGLYLSQKQQSIVYKMKLNNDNFRRAARLYIQALEAIIKIIRKNKVTTNKMKWIAEKITELRALILTLTNASLRKQARQFNLFVARKKGLTRKAERREHASGFRKVRE